MLYDTVFQVRTLEGVLAAGTTSGPTQIPVRDQAAIQAALGSMS